MGCFGNCELPNSDQADCQSNKVGDVCDIASGTSLDVNVNSVPDECETCLFDTDCSDSLFCTGEETCSQGECHTGIVSCDGTEVCDEDDASAQAAHRSATDGGCLHRRKCPARGGGGYVIALASGYTGRRNRSHSADRHG